MKTQLRAMIKEDSFRELMDEGNTIIKALRREGGEVEVQFKLVAIQRKKPFDFVEWFKSLFETKPEFTVLVNRENLMKIIDGKESISLDIKTKREVSYSLFNIDYDTIYNIMDDAYHTK